MPTDVKAILAYGYDLGGPSHSDGWNLHADMVGTDPFPWWGRPSDSFTRAAYEELQHARRERHYIDVAGVEMLEYGSDTIYGIGVGYILSAAHYSTYYSHGLPLPLDFPPPGMEGEWARRLGHALDVLQFQPRAVGPHWILAAHHY